VQKPIARNSVEAREMIDVARKSGKLLGVTMEERGNVVYRQMKQMVEAGCIGEVVQIEAMMAHTRHMRNPVPKDDWRASPELIGGGSFIQLAIHHVDLARWILNDDIIEVGAVSTGGRCNDLFPCDETTVAWTRFAGGAVGSFTSSFACDADVFFIHGTGGYVGKRGTRMTWEVNQPFDGEAWCCDKACEPGHVELDWYPSRPSRTKREYEQHRRFALAIRGVIPLETTAEEGLKDLLVVEAVHKAAEEKRAVEVPQNN
jgi:predicted dehydrogenase